MATSAGGRSYRRSPSNSFSVEVVGLRREAPLVGAADPDMVARLWVVAGLVARPRETFEEDVDEAATGDVPHVRVGLFVGPLRARRTDMGDEAAPIIGGEPMPSVQPDIFEVSAMFGPAGHNPFEGFETGISGWRGFIKERQEMRISKVPGGTTADADEVVFQAWYIPMTDVNGRGPAPSC